MIIMMLYPFKLNLSHLLKKHLCSGYVLCYSQRKAEREGWKRFHQCQPTRPQALILLVRQPNPIYGTVAAKKLKEGCIYVTLTIRNVVGD